MLLVPCLQGLISTLGALCSFWRPFFCYIVSSCVYDHNCPYLVSERLFLAEYKVFRTCEEQGRTQKEQTLHFEMLRQLNLWFFHGQAEKLQNERVVFNPASWTSQSITDLRL